MGELVRSFTMESCGTALSLVVSPFKATDDVSVPGQLSGSFGRWCHVFFIRILILESTRTEGGIKHISLNGLDRKDNSPIQQWPKVLRAFEMRPSLATSEVLDKFMCCQGWLLIYLHLLLSLTVCHFQLFEMGSPPTCSRGDNIGQRGAQVRKRRRNGVC